MVVGLCVPHCRAGLGFLFCRTSSRAQDRCLGIQGVYRISFALAVFFLAMALLCKCVPLAHRGGWMWKYIAFFGLIIVSFLIPSST